MTVLRLRAFDQAGSDHASWELRRESYGYVWWYWPCLSNAADLDWERVQEIPPAATAGKAEEDARAWFRENEPGLSVEIVAGTGRN